MTTVLREVVFNNKPEILLQDEIEIDKVYIVCGHKGHLQEVKKEGGGKRNHLKSAQGRGTLKTKKPPVFGIIQRTNEVIIQMMSNVKKEKFYDIYK